MSSNDIIVSLDIGTSKVRAIIGEVNNGSLNIIGVGTANSDGIRKGSIVDIDQTVQSIRNAIDHAERMVDIQISEVYVGISGNHIELQPTHGVVAVSNEDREIGNEDIERVLDAAKVVAIPPEREIIGIVPQQFVVDGLEGIQDPRGMIGVRLEVNATIITGKKTAVHNLRRCVERADLRISGIILNPLAASHLVLSKDEKTLGTILVDIGAGATTLSVFEGGHLTATSTLPIGGDYITHDISIGLRTQTDIAEKIKLKYGCATVELAESDQVFKVPRIGSNLEKQFSQVDLSNIIEPRVREILQMVAEEAGRLTQKEFTGGFVLTGGTVSMPGLLDAAQQELGSSVRIAVPDYVGVRDPSYTNGVGILQYVLHYVYNRGFRPQKKSGNRKLATGVSKENKDWLERLKNFFKEFI